MLAEAQAQVQVLTATLHSSLPLNPNLHCYINTSLNLLQDMCYMRTFKCCCSCSARILSLQIKYVQQRALSPPLKNVLIAAGSSLLIFDCMFLTVQATCIPLNLHLSN
uniref:Uncharacterized protein n=1 Tax=Opuntia streptacantha TaxID=393608 RepID=A0A7C9CJ52_OPUST